MSERYTEIVILCEDFQHFIFAKTFLEECGIDSRRIRLVLLPKKGAGESFVKREYPREVKSFRQFSSKKHIGLVVMMDADSGSVQEHFVQLDRSLRARNLEARSPKERIGIFIPKWHIETWIMFLEGKDVDEKIKYPHYKDETACKPLVRELARNRHQPLPDNAPESLKMACRELPRIFP